MIIYTKLEKILEERNITKVGLQNAIGIAPNTVAKIKKNEPMNTSVLDKICEYLEVQPGDIMEWVSDEALKERKRADIQEQIKQLQNQLSEI